MVLLFFFLGLFSPLCVVCRERYIPITRRSVIRLLTQDEGLLSEEEKKQFHEFALALDSAIVSKYHGILQELNVSHKHGSFWQALYF